MNQRADSEQDPRTPLDALLDALIYAPIGLTLDARDVGPDLAQRGRQHAAAARQIGELAVKAGLRKLEDAMGQGDAEASADSAQAPSKDATTPTSPAEEAPEPSTPSSSELAIPDYDSLAASQVVKRLDALTEAELEAVRHYESATRDRRTILHKIARLQD